MMASTKRKFKRIIVRGAWEEVYELPVKGTDKTTLRVFSSVDKSTGWSRDKGTDAIRIVAWDTAKNRNVDGETKTLRTTGWDERLKEKLEELYERVLTQQCPNCGAMLIVREGKHGKFLGCSAYPGCKYIHGKKVEPESSKPMVEVVDKETGEVTYKRVDTQQGIGKWLLVKTKSILKIVSGNACPKCGGALKERQGKHGSFIGCSNYPSCDFTKSR